MVASETAWHSSQETLLKDLAQRCISRSVLHRIEYANYYRFNSAITIPTIVISLLAGAASAAQATLVEMVGENMESHVPLIIGMLSMLISILNSVSSFLKIPALTEQNLQSHLQFEKLSRQIQSEICVRAADRKLSGREACQKFEAAFQQLLDISPPVSAKSERKFTRRRDVRSLQVPVPHTIKMSKLRTYSEMERDRRLDIELEKQSVAKRLGGGLGAQERGGAQQSRSRVPSGVDNIFQSTDEHPAAPTGTGRATEPRMSAAGADVLSEIRGLQGLRVVRNYKEGRLHAGADETEEWASASSDLPAAADD